MVLLCICTLESPSELLKTSMPLGLKPRGPDELAWVKNGMVMKDFLSNGTHEQPPAPCMLQGPVLEPTKHMERATESPLGESKGQTRKMSHCFLSNMLLRIFILS